MLSARWWTLAVWALAAASALFWGLKLFVKPPAAPPHTQVADTGLAARGDLSRLLGADAPPPVLANAEPVADARFQLIGVVSPRPRNAAREGLALIAVDGKPARAYRVGASVDGDTVLQTVGARGVTLGPRDGAALVALNLAPPPLAATGTLPSLTTPQGLPAPQAMPQRPMQQQQQQQQFNALNPRRVLPPQQMPQGNGTEAPGVQQPDHTGNSPQTQ